MNYQVMKMNCLAINFLPNSTRDVNNAVVSILRLEQALHHGTHAFIEMSESWLDFLMYFSYYAYKK